MKKLILTAAAAGMMLAGGTAAHADGSIQYEFNGQDQPETASKMFMENNRVLVPLRTIFEDLGAEVTWHQESREITASNENASIHMHADEQIAFVNDEEVTIDQTPIIREGHTFVPLRFVSEAFGANVGWDGSTQTVTVTESGHTETIERPGSDEDNVLSETDINLFDWMPVLPGESWDGGTADETLETAYDFSWDVVYGENASFHFVGAEDGTVDAVFAPMTPEMTDEDITRGDVRDRFGQPERWLEKNGLHFNYGDDETWDFFEINDYYVTVFYDRHEEDRVGGVQIIHQDAEHAKEGFYGNRDSDTISESYARELWLLTNMEREMAGLEPLEWNEKAAAAAGEHSADMADNLYFSHDNQMGQSPFDRMRDHDILFKHAGENLARNQISPLHAHFNLLYSESHRETMLSDKYEENGIGVHFTDDHQPYFTQKFITEYEVD
ncbi:stalk domain-containing protein [Alkalicoccus chagannorensis]|uniref:stalk domain-containing protein n=1 Tax=Alkalicoccus chagannorensis TaxID=427072 RepID=UPI0004185612|nr:stalk domain-containing protein [Alkalicoccus chagannorensis]